jgi:hypothetical protein
MANGKAGVDLQQYHDDAKGLAERAQVAGAEWQRRKLDAKFAKDDYDALLENLVAYTAEDNEPATPLLDDDL